MIKITFPDGTSREFEKGINSLQIAEQISHRLAKEVYSATVNGEVWDLTRPIETDATLRLNKWEDEEGRHAFWHSSAHLMAEALESLYPGIKFGIGPAIENGFYYDVDPGDDRVITDADLVTIENRMKELAATNESYKRRQVSKKEAMDIYTKKGDEYKTELISELQDGTITLYTQSSFSVWRAHTGVEMKTARCLPASMALLFLSRSFLMNILFSSKRQRKGITEGSGKNWSSSPFHQE